MATAVALAAAVAAVVGCGGESSAEVTVTRTTSSASPATTTEATTGPAVTAPDTLGTTAEAVTTEPSTTTAGGDDNPLTRDYSQADLRLIEGAGLSTRQCRRREPDRGDGERSYIVCVTGRVTTVYVRFTGRAATVRDWRADLGRTDVEDDGFQRGECDRNGRTLGTWSNSGRRRGRFYCGLLDSGGGANIGWTYTADNVTAFAFSTSGEIPLAGLHRWWQTRSPSDIT